jgi:HEAT repeat protein
MIDIDADCRALLARLVTGDRSAVDRLVEIGVPAVSILVSQFPGPLDSITARRFAEPEARASECGLVLETIVHIGTVAIPFLVVRTADRDPMVRRWATWLLGELPTADAARAVARRFGDEDTEVRRAALAAGRMMQSDVEARTALRDGLATLAAEPTQPPDVRHGNIEAMAALRDPRAVPRLIPLVGNSNPAIARSAHWALVTLARQDFEYDTKRWTVWWHKNSDRHRVEWLIDSLTHDVQEIRRAAGEELKTLSKEYFGYYEDLPPSERASAQRQYREWWETKGKAHFR